MWPFQSKPKARPRLVLHVGTHKTGTTSIQLALRDNRATLLKAGICYPDPGRDPHPDLPAHNFIYRATLDGPEVMAAERALIWEEFRASRANCLILSEEGLSLPRDKLQAFFEPWKDVFDISIVCYLRRQDRYAESLYSQYVREGKDIALGTIESFLEVPMIAARFAYHRNLTRWDSFGPVHAVNYDLLKSDALHRPILDAAAPGQTLKIAPPPQANVSPPAGAIEVIRQINRLGLDYALWPLVTRLRRAPPEALVPMLSRRGMMGFSLRQRFMAGLAPANQTLAEARGVVFSPDMPDEPATPFHVDIPEALIRDLAAASLAGKP
ncbi:hypothetical protein [Pseudorhodobacter sp.]|uniref:hypothetical protein n=1 Tax=Pseudorhodobacter sp. TaxID=1934400 RepID=UPI002648D9FA|nr:hypothetical protein [Pseudorhodobacter sp.]MDN5788266.1 hypothetical protein [Pseudorhodobacter sp.]